MIFLYVSIGAFAMIHGIVDCELIANKTFTVTEHYSKGDGIRSASATCYMEFPVVQLDQAWIVTRFGVPITNYLDYYDGGWNTSETGKWIITKENSSIYSGPSDYQFAFDYEVWLGAAVPSGDCSLFTVQQEADYYADNTPELYDTPASTLLATSSLMTISSTQAECSFSFPGISLGSRDAVILVNFTVPVENNVISGYGHEIIHEANDNTWYIVSVEYQQNNDYMYQFDFTFMTADQDLSAAQCYMYVSTADALSAATGTSAVLPTTTTSTITTSTVNNTTSSDAVSSSTSTSTITTSTDAAFPETSAGTNITSSDVASSTTTTSTVTTSSDLPTAPTSTITASSDLPTTSTGTFTTPTVAASSTRSRATLIESMEMRDKYVNENSLWKKVGVNLMRCGRLCMKDDRCVSVFHYEKTATCTGHHVVHGSGIPMPGVTYYIIT